MGKYDILFEKIVTSEELANELGPDAKRYKTVAGSWVMGTGSVAQLKKGRSNLSIIRSASWLMRHEQRDEGMVQNVTRTASKYRKSAS